MNAAQVAGLIARRAMLVTWFHALPPATATLNESVGQPGLGLGVAQTPGTGYFGESFLPGVLVKGLYQRRSTSFQQRDYGVIDDQDCQLDFAVPWWADWDVTPLTASTTPSVDDFNNGNFASVTQGSTMVCDQFLVNNQRFVAKALPVALTDENVVFAYRIALTKVTL